MKFKIKQHYVLALVFVISNVAAADLCGNAYDILSHNIEFNISVECAPGDPDTYLGFNFSANAGPYANLTDIGGWCVDLNRQIYCNESFSVDSYSSYDYPNIPDGAVDKPQNLDLVNWLINTYPTESFVNITGCYTGLLGYEEYQEAVWTIVDHNDTLDLHAEDCIVEWLVNQAETYGDGYEIPCNETDAKMGILLVIDDDSGFITHQVVMAEIPINDLDGVCDCNHTGNTGGDPHFKTWAGEHYDFHGLCDLVLLENHGFSNGLGMDIHIRTKKMRSFSYISNAVVRIGEDTLEVMGKKGGSQYWINGLPGENTQQNNVILPQVLSGYPVTFKLGFKKQHEYHVDLGHGQMIVIKTWNNLVRVDVLGATEENFGSSRGLMGKYASGEHLARDGLTVLADLDAFGQEWQVLNSEVKLFHNLEGAQSPQSCEFPSAMEARRRLGETLISQLEAEAACRAVHGTDRELCIFDVMATNDADVVEAYL